jgi:uncharacterized protein (DUF983 family)
MSKEKLAEAMWIPVLEIECPHCGRTNDYSYQWQEMNFPFKWFKHFKQEELKGIMFDCPECGEGFGLYKVYY